MTESTYTPLTAQKPFLMVIQEQYLHTRAKTGFYCVFMSFTPNDKLEQLKKGNPSVLFPLHMLKYDKQLLIDFDKILHKHHLKGDWYEIHDEFILEDLQKAIDNYNSRNTLNAVNPINHDTKR